MCESMHDLGDGSLHGCAEDVLHYLLSRMPTELSLGSSGSELDVSIVPIVRHQDVVSFEV
jgi:hypothetical protein